MSSSYAAGGAGEMVPTPTPALFEDERILQAEATLYPDLSDTTVADLDALHETMCDQGFKAKKLLQEDGVVAELHTICEDMPNTVYAARARELLLAGCNIFIDRGPKTENFVADNALDSMRETMRRLHEAFPGHTEHNFIAERFMGYGLLMKRIAKSDRWGPRHTKQLAGILRDYPQYAPLVSSHNEVELACLRDMGLPADITGLDLNDATRRQINGERWFPDRYRAWRSLQLASTQPDAPAALYKQFGLRNFGCTSQRHLERMYHNRDNPPRQTSFALVPAPGIESAFMNSLKIYEKMHEGAGSDRDWFIVEYATVEELAERLDALHEQWGERLGLEGGIKEVPFISLLGHGRYGHINVNHHFENGEQVSDKFDTAAMRDVIGPRLRKLAMPGTTVILDTCEPAARKDNLADAARQSTGCRIVAPEGFSLLESATFVPGAAGELAVRTTFMGVTEVRKGQYKWEQTGQYVYPALS